MFRKIFNSELHRISVDEFKESTKNPFVVVLDNVRSQHNIGSVFRTADAFRAEKVILCGICATPPSAEIHKAALGAEFSVDYEYFKETIDAVSKLKDEGYIIVGIEQSDNSTMLQDFAIEKGKKYALIFGNEVYGVEQQVLDMCDECIEIPQYGTKHSLNVSVSAGIALWAFMNL